MIGWVLGLRPTEVFVLAGTVALVLIVGILLLVRAAWRSVDPPYEAVRRRPPRRDMKPWMVDPVTERVAFVRETEPQRRSLDPAWRERVLADQPTAPARHRPEHLEEETRAWDPEDLRRRIRERGEELDRG